MDSLKLTTINTIIDTLSEDDKRQIIYRIYMTMNKYEDPLFPSLENLAEEFGLSIGFDTEEFSNMINVFFMDDSDCSFDILINDEIEDKGDSFKFGKGRVPEYIRLLYCKKDEYKYHVIYEIDSFSKIKNLLDTFKKNGNFSRNHQILNLAFPYSEEGDTDLSYDQVIDTLHEHSSHESETKCDIR